VVFWGANSFKNPNGSIFASPFASLSTVDGGGKQYSPRPQTMSWTSVSNRCRKSSQGLSVFNWMMVRWDWEPIVTIVAAVVVLLPAAVVVLLLLNPFLKCVFSLKSAGAVGLTQISQIDFINVIKIIKSP